MALARHNTAELQRSLSESRDRHAEHAKSQAVVQAGSAVVDSSGNERIDAIVGLGFTKDDAERALQACADDMDKAIDALLNGTLPPAPPATPGQSANSTHLSLKVSFFFISSFCCRQVCCCTQGLGL